MTNVTFNASFSFDICSINFTDMKYIIVGAVAGGASTAARLRRLDEHAEIIIFEKLWFWKAQFCVYIDGQLLP